MRIRKRLARGGNRRNCRRGRSSRRRPISRLPLWRRQPLGHGQSRHCKGQRPKRSPPRAPSRHDMVAQLPHKWWSTPCRGRSRRRNTGWSANRLGRTAAVQPQPSSPSAAQADQHAQVNVEELGTRIEGINLSLRNLEAELNEKRDFTADQLDSLLSRLDILVLRQKDLTLFRDLIAPQEQAKVGQIDSSRSRRRHAWAPASPNCGSASAKTKRLPEAERTAALKHLDELSDRLATMTAEKVSAAVARIITPRQRYLRLARSL